MTFAIGFDHRRRDLIARSMFRKKLKQRRVAQILFEIGAVIQILGIDLRHRQTMPAKMPGEFQEGRVLFAHVVQMPIALVFRRPVG